MKTIQIGIIGNDIIARNMLCKLVKPMTCPKFEIAIEAETLVGFATVNTAKLAIDVILLDVLLAGIDEVSAIGKLLSLYPAVTIIVLSDSNELDTIFKCIQAGALAYIKKDGDQQALLTIIKEVLAGGSYVSPVFTRMFFEEVREKWLAIEQLTARERNIVDGIEQGLSYKLIAEKYSISLDTVRVHIKKVYKKLHINSKGELMHIIRF